MKRTFRTAVSFMLCLALFTAGGRAVYADTDEPVQQSEDAGGTAEEGEADAAADGQEKTEESEYDKKLREIEQEKAAMQDQMQELQQQAGQTEGQLNQTQGNISSLQGQQGEVAGQMDVTEMSIAQNIASIEILEEEIADLETQIAIKQAEYDAACEEEQIRYDAMKNRIRFMYEKGDSSYIDLLMTATSFGDLLNKSAYVEALYDYDRQLLIQFQEIQRQVAAVQAELADQRSELEESQHGLEEEQAALQVKLAALESQYADYAERISAAQSQANALRNKMSSEQSRISSLQQQMNAKAQEEQQTLQAKAQAEAAEKAAKEAAARAAQAAAEATSKTTASSASAVSVQASSASSSSSSETSTAQTKTYSAPGSATGQNVASFASQFVGNPYVYGGTSLTAGCDCSGFTMSVYRNFGISLPRTAEEQRGAGTAVASLEEARPGDLCCYPGHVGIYIGGGQIVHASTAATGIKYSNANYRPIVCIRRIVN